MVEKSIKTTSKCQKLKVYFTTKISINKLNRKLNGKFDSAVDYADALSFMEGRVADIEAGNKAEYVWLLEHPPVLTKEPAPKMQI